MYEMLTLRQSQKGSLVKRVDSLLRPLIRDLGIEGGIRFIEVKKNWHVLFNEPISYHLIPYKITEGTILLKVDSPVWLQEMIFFKREIIEKLGPYGIKDVRFQLGNVSKKTRSEVCNQDSNAKALTPEEILYMEKAASQVIDEELRGTVRRAIEKAISSTKTKVRY
jgi:hypothetical protein